MIRLLLGRARLGARPLLGLLLWALAGVSAAAFSEDGLPTATTGVVPDYAAAVQPIFNRRCIACHGCLGSPCNVKLDSFRGVDRGGFRLNPYSVHFDDFERAISTMTAVDERRFVRFLPGVRVLRLNHRDEQRVYSLVANRVFASQWTLVFQNGQALPNEDTLSVYPTLVNGFPNLFVDLDLAQAPGFLSDLAAVETDDTWRRLQERYVILRNGERFWPFYDWLNN